MTTSNNNCFLPYPVASNIFCYEQEDHEPLDDDDSPVHSFHLVIKPEYREPICTALGSDFTYNETGMCAEFTNGGLQTYRFFIDIGMMELYHLEQTLGNPAVPNTTKTPIMENLMSRITTENGQDMPKIVSLFTSVLAADGKAKIE